MSYLAYLLQRYRRDLEADAKLGLVCHHTLQRVRDIASMLIGDAA